MWKTEDSESTDRSGWIIRERRTVWNRAGIKNFETGG